MIDRWEQMLHPPLIPIVLARAAAAGPAIPELMIDGRPAAAALIKKSRRVGMTAFLGWISGVPLMLTIAIACKIQDRSFRLCWQGESASTATRAFARVIVASWHINRLQGGRDVDRATPSDAHTQNDESGRVKACQNAARSSVIGSKVEIFCSV